MPRNAQIRLRLSDEEKAQIEARAKEQGQKPAEFVRDLALYGHRPGEWAESPTLAERWVGARNQSERDAVRKELGAEK